MPGVFPGRVASVHCERSIDIDSEKVDRPAVAEMVAAGMTALTGAPDARSAWSQFFNSTDVVGIKINAWERPVSALPQN